MSSNGDDFSDPAPSSPPEFSNARKTHASTRHSYKDDGVASDDLDDIAQRDRSIDRESDLDDDDGDRENRFQGLPNAWHAYTREERGLAASLNQSRANELGIHLYNTHALKARLNNPELAESWRSKSSWIQADENGKLPWQPDRQWTAWPMPPAQVPRPGETFGTPITQNDGNETYRKAVPWTPSADLQDELQAVMLRKAKQRFRRRQWTSAGSLKDSTANVSPDSDDSLDPDAAIVATKTETVEFPEEQTFTPVILADDEQASEILEPSARHILAKLDELLIGLHKSRNAHRHQTSVSRSRSRPAGSGSPSRSKATQKTSAADRNTKRRRLTTDNDSDAFQSPGSKAESDHGDKHEPPIEVPGKTKPSGPSEHVLGLRDWSEVLGMASLVGWDQDIVDRTARRCASLFGEGMSFRNMAESTVSLNRDRRVDYIPDILPAMESEISEDEELTTPEAAVMKKYFCPFADCPRRQRSFPKGFRWREHLVRSHKLSRNQVEELENAIPGSRAVSHARGAKEGARDEHEMEATDDPVDDVNDKMYGGVHIDGFMEPVTAPFGRGNDTRKSVKRRGRSQNPSESEQSDE